MWELLARTHNLSTVSTDGGVVHPSTTCCPRFVHACWRMVRDSWLMVGSNVASVCILSTIF